MLESVTSVNRHVTHCTTQNVLDTATDRREGTVGAWHLPKADLVALKGIGEMPDAPEFSFTKLLLTVQSLEDELVAAKQSAKKAASERDVVRSQVKDLKEHFTVCDMEMQKKVSDLQKDLQHWTARVCLTICTCPSNEAHCHLYISGCYSWGFAIIWAASKPLLDLKGSVKKYPCISTSTKHCADVPNEKCWILR